MYSPTPAPPQAPPTGRRSRGRRVAVVIWLVLFLIAAILTVVRIVDYSSQPEDQRVPAAGGTVTITEPGEYTVYGESDLRVAGNYPGLASVTSPSGAAVPVSASGMSETYNVNERGGRRIGTFTAAEPGPYTLSGVTEGTAPGDQLVVSTRTVGAVLSIVFGSIVTGALLLAGLIGGLVLWLVGRRRRTTAEAMALAGQYGPGQYGPGPYGPAPPYGSPPHGMPRYGPAGYGSGPYGGPATPGAAQPAGPYGAGPAPQPVPGGGGQTGSAQVPGRPPHGQVTPGHVSPGRPTPGQVPPGPPPAGLGARPPQQPSHQPAPSDDATTVVGTSGATSDPGSEDETVVARPPDDDGKRPG